MHRPKYSRNIAIAVAVVAGAVGAASGVGAVAATSGAGTVNAPAGPTTTTGLVVSVAYAENVGDIGGVPAWFPTPWCILASATSTACTAGANPDNVTMVGQPDPNGSATGQECAPSSKNPALTTPYCWDEGAVRLDNQTASSITVSGVAVNVRCNTSSGMLFYGGTISPTGYGCGSGRTRQLWAGSACSGCFFPLTIQSGKSVILTGNPPPPAHQNTFVNFDFSDTPHNLCTPGAAAPTVTIVSNVGSTVSSPITDTFTDSAHVLDTGWWVNGTFGGTDSGWCPTHQNESVQWEQIGWAPRSTTPMSGSTPQGLAAKLTLSPATASPTSSPIQETATLLGGDGVPLANAPLNLSVTNGPDKGESFTQQYTGGNGQAVWSLSNNGNAGADTVVVTGGFIPAVPVPTKPPYAAYPADPNLDSNSCVAWGGATCGAPPPNDFSISASPNTVTVAPGSGGTTMINTATTSGSPQSVALSASGFPPGAGATFSTSPVTSGGSSTMTITTSPSTPTGSTTLTVTGTGSSATHTTMVTLVVQTSPPPPPGCPPTPWTCADIGSPTSAGSETYDSGIGKWTINAGGSDIFSNADHFRFDYQSTAATTTTVEAQITGQTNSNAWAKAGVMMRLDNTPGSPQFSVLITPGNGIFVEYRSTAGGTTTRAGTVAGQLPPKYIWVVRSGTTFTGYYSSTNNLATATKLFSQTIAAMSGTVLEGLAATSHSSALCTVTMDTVTLS